ncbi:MAG: hypothetical protein ABFD69_12355 [Candidatus Sumerlaeia bacterium]
MLTLLNKFTTDTAGHSAAEAAGWNFRWLVCALVIAFLMQGLFLPCLCQIGEARMRVAIIFDGLVILRMAIAGFRRERGSGWIFYAALLYSSPLWIAWAIRHA